MTISATLQWTNGFQFVGRSGNGPAVVMDSTDGGSGPTPMQMLLFGVAGCTGIDVVLILKKKRLSLADFQITITGEQQAEEPRRFTTIHIEYLIVGKHITPKAVEQAISLSETKYCSAMASLNASFSRSYRIVDPDA